MAVQSLSAKKAEMTVPQVIYKPHCFNGVRNGGFILLLRQSPIYSATTFLEKCRKVVQEKWFEKSGSRNLVREKWLTRKQGGHIL